MGLLSSLRDRFVDDEDAEHMRVAESPEGIAAAIARDYRQEPIPTDPHGYFYGPLAQGGTVGADGRRQRRDLELAHRCRRRRREVLHVAGLGHHRTAGTGWNGSTRWSTASTAIPSPITRRSSDAVRTVRDQPRVSDADWAAALRDEAARVEAPAGYADALCETIPAIHAAEQTLRQAHLLGADEEVVALDGYDYLRAGNIARWGVHLGFGSFGYRRECRHRLPRLGLAVVRQLARVRARGARRPDRHLPGELGAASSHAASR